MITLLKVRNYKSLENVELPLGALHVFVGPNNSGKSNLFDALHFLRELAVIGGQAVHSRGGFSQIVWGGDVKRAISLEIHALVENGKKWEPSRPHDRLFLEQLQDEDRYGPLAIFARDAFSWSIYNFEPSAMRKPNAVKQDFHFNSTGEKFSSVIHSIQSEHGTKFNEIENLLETALPEVRRLFTALTKEGQAYVSMEEEAMSVRIPAWAMSTGTLRLLGQLAALYSPKPPALACYEEPENYVHPALLSLLADVFKSAGPKHQILISTYSPYLLDNFSPQHLIVVEKKNGCSQFSFVSKKKGLKEALRVLGLGEIWHSGELGGTP